MNDLNLTVAITALTVLAIALVYSGVQRSWLSVPMLATAVGVAFGPEVAGLVRPEAWPRPMTLLEEAARFTVAISVVGIALRTPKEDLRRLIRPVAGLLLAGMAAMWAVSSGIAWAVAGLAPLPALLLGAVITPTDPVVASAIATGEAAEESLPDRLRSALSLESGANDGLAYLIVFLPLLLIVEGTGAATWGEWARDTVGIGILGALGAGVALGLAAGQALRRLDAHGLTPRVSMLSLSVGLSLGAMAATHLFGGDGILAAFAAGAAFNTQVTRSEHFETERVQEAISKLFTIPFFVLFGAMLPWAEWIALGWTGPLAAAAVLLLRRPAGVLAARPALGGFPRRDLVFLGWYGPVGVAAVFYATLVAERTGDDVYWHLTSLIVVASVVAHGLTATPGRRAYARRAGRPAV